jgi:rod shape-determining protein MreD
MNNITLRNIIRFVVLVFIQVLIFNNISLKSYLVPYIYVLFILLLPFETPKWLLLVSGFFLGFFVDMFSNTAGVHTAATVLMAFIRPFAGNFVSAKHEYEEGIQPGIRALGFRWFFSYSLLLVSAHHILLYYLEVFSFRAFFLTLWHAILNIFFTMLFIILSQLILSGQKKNI